MKSLRNVWTTSFLALAMIGVTAMAARAADEKAAAAAGATGTWKWSFATQDGQQRETTAKLTQDGEKLTGTVSGRNNTETEIQDGKVKDGTVTFKLVRKFNDREMTSKYEGKLDGDAIKGKIVTTGGDQDRTRDWEAKRAKDAK